MTALSLWFVFTVLVAAVIMLWQMGLKDFSKAWVDASRQERALKRQIEEELRRR